MGRSSWQQSELTKNSPRVDANPFKETLFFISPTVGGSFQWPPPKEDGDDQGATATPLYMDPGHPKAGVSSSDGESLPPMPQPQQQQLKSEWDATLNANKAVYFGGLLQNC